LDPSKTVVVCQGIGRQLLEGMDEIGHVVFGVRGVAFPEHLAVAPHPFGEVLQIGDDLDEGFGI